MPISMQSIAENAMSYALMAAVGVIVVGLVVSWFMQGLKATIDAFGLFIGWGAVLLTALYPWVVYAYGKTFPELNVPAPEGLWSITMPDSTLRGFIRMAALGGVCALLVAFAAGTARSLSTILFNGAGNFVMTMWIVGHVAQLVGAKQVMYYQLFSARIAAVATFVALLAAFIGAWNKNPMQAQMK